MTARAPSMMRRGTEQLEMGISHADFHRILPRVVAPQMPRYTGLQADVEWPSGYSLQLIISPEKVREIGGLKLVYVELRFDFHGFSPAAQAAFMTRFKQAFHKGGG